MGSWPASSVQFNGADIPFSDNTKEDFTKNFWTYDATTLTVLINIGTPVSTSISSTAKITFTQSLQHPLLLNGFTRKLDRLQQCKDLLDDEWEVYHFHCFICYAFIYLYLFKLFIYSFFI